MTIPAENNDVLRPDTQVTITGRNVEVPDHFAERVHAKLAKIARLDPTLTFFHVELQHEPNPRRADESDKIQITATGKGHIARAEAKEDSFYAALETALARMERSLRKVKARRRISRTAPPKVWGRSQRIWWQMQLLRYHTNPRASLMWIPTKIPSPTLCLVRLFVPRNTPRHR